MPIMQLLPASYWLINNNNLSESYHEDFEILIQPIHCDPVWNSTSVWFFSHFWVFLTFHLPFSTFSTLEVRLLLLPSTIVQPSKQKQYVWLGLVAVVLIYQSGGSLLLAIFHSRRVSQCLHLHFTHINSPYGFSLYLAD